jgi:hypothetical protein
VNAILAIRPWRAVSTAVVVLGFAWPLAARAYRPFNSTDAAVAEKGEMEIEFGPLGFVKDGPDRSLVTPSVIFNWGFAHGWELVLEGRHFVQLGEKITTPRFRVEDSGLSLKRVLREGSLQEKTGPSVATEVGALLPTINGDDSGMGAEGALIVSQRWPDLTVHLNAAVAWTRAHRPGFFGGTIFEVHDAWAVRPVAEVFVEAERDVPTAVSGLVGAIWRVRDGLSFDAGLRLARAAGVNTTEIRAGLTWAFSVGFPR